MGVGLLITIFAPLAFLSWAPTVGLILYVAPITLTVLALLLVSASTAYYLPPRRPLRERSVLISRLVSFGSFSYGTLLLVLGGFAGALIAIDLLGIEQLNADESREPLGRSALLWLQVVAVVVFIGFVTVWAGRLTLDLVLARFDARDKALRKVFHVTDQQRDAGEAPRRTAWARHLAHPSYAWISFLAFSTGIYFPVLVLIMIATFVTSPPLQ